MKSKIVLLFDVDGVIVDTPHENAWRAVALEWKLIVEDFNFKEFYQKYVAGIPGLEGAKIILEKTGYYEEQNIVTKEEKQKKAKEFRKIKQNFLDEYIAKGEFKIFEDIKFIIEEAKKNKIPIAAVSSSENAEKMLKKIGLFDHFDSTTLGAIKHRALSKEALYGFAFGRLCGTLNQDHLPTPIIFEDADKGVIAAKNLGHFCIGIAREGLTTKESLINTGADLAYDDLSLSNSGYSRIMRDLNKKQLESTKGS